MEISDSLIEAPDLARGTIVNGWGSSNRWQTGIEAVLRRRRYLAEPDLAFLSHECRAEAVGENIFAGMGRYEFAVVEGFEGTWNFRHGAALHSLRPSARKAAGRDVAPKPASHPSRVFCRNVPVDALSFDEVLAYLREDGEDKGNNLYMRLEWKRGSTEYQLYAPCRYTNFPPPDSQEAYLQPISGQVLVDLDDGLYIAYVACHVTPAGTQSIEFIVRGAVSFLGLKTQAGLVGAAVRFLDRFVVGRFLATDEYAEPHRFQGNCRFFRYPRLTGR